MRTATSTFSMPLLRFQFMSAGRRRGSTRPVCGSTQLMLMRLVKKISGGTSGYWSPQWMRKL